MHAKTFFFIKKRYDFFFNFETLGRMHKNIFSFLIFLYFLEVLTKTGYFNIEFCIFSNIKNIA